jgi:hypothetical protein
MRAGYAAAGNLARPSVAARRKSAAPISWSAKRLLPRQINVNFGSFLVHRDNHNKSPLAAEYFRSEAFGYCLQDQIPNFIF